MATDSPGCRTPHSSSVLESSMTIQRLDLFHVDLPLRSRVKHASHDRISSDSLIARITLEDGTTGYGEGVPRLYVTGETIATTFESLQVFDVAKHVGRPSDYAEVVNRLEALEFPETAADPRGMAGNAAHCALEMAVLDAYGRRFSKSYGDAVRLVKVCGVSTSSKPTRVRYSGAITAASFRKEIYSAARMWLYGFRQIKVKVGVPGQDDVARLRALRKVVSRKVDLRIDANESWTPEETVERVKELLPFHPSVLEQPVPHAKIEELASLRPEIGMPIMLDESLCGYPDAVHAIEHHSADLFNVRLSKCGGLIASLRIIGLAMRSGIGLQLGCHPGETGLLSAAGRHFASNVRGFQYVEGSYDAHILERNVTTGNMTFGYGGLAPPLLGPGLGVEVDLSALDAMTKNRLEICYE